MPERSPPLHAALEAESRPTPDLQALIAAGDFDRAIDAAGPEQSILARDLDSIAKAIGASIWLRDHGLNDEVRRGAADIVDAVEKIARQWISNARPRALNPLAAPKSRADLANLMVRILTRAGYYHRPRVPDLQPENLIWRANAHPDGDRFYEGAYALIEAAVRRAAGRSLAGCSVIDVGCADGYHAIRLAEAGARVLAVDKIFLAAVRSAVFSALAGVSDRMAVKVMGVSGLHRLLASVAKGGAGTASPDVVLAAGLIYHFDDLEPNLRCLTAFRAPIIFTFQATAGDDLDVFDAAAHRDTEDVSLPWLLHWLDGEGFDGVVEPGWSSFVAQFENLNRGEMVLAIPRAAS